jgi:hypothetical protein
MPTTRQPKSGAQRTSGVDWEVGTTRPRKQRKDVVVVRAHHQTDDARAPDMDLPNRRWRRAYPSIQPLGHGTVHSPWGSSPERVHAVHPAAPCSRGRPRHPHVGPAPSLRTGVPPGTWWPAAAMTAGPGPGTAAVWALCGGLQAIRMVGSMASLERNSFFFFEKCGAQRTIRSCRCPAALRSSSVFFFSPAVAVRGWNYGT